MSSFAFAPPATAPLVARLACGILGLGVLKPLYASNFFWISVVWTFVYGLLLTRLALGRSASTM